MFFTGSFAFQHTYYATSALYHEAGNVTKTPGYVTLKKGSFKEECEVMSNPRLDQSAQLTHESMEDYNASQPVNNNKSI